MITALAPWFGSNRLLAPIVGKELEGCRWVGIPFAGGMAELATIKAPTILVSDLHRHVINLARVVAHDELGPKLYRKVGRLAFHPETLAAAQEFSRTNLPGDSPDFAAAMAYFTCCWMGRSGQAGTDDEFSGSLPVRWSASGGDSNTRYRSAVRSLIAWRRLLQRCNFLTLDVFEFLDRVKDKPRHGLFLDPPWPDDGGNYRHKFDDSHQRRLAERLAAFRYARVVVRFGDHPLIRELYPESQWRWRKLAGRTQTNGTKREVLLSKYDIRV